MKVSFKKIQNFSMSWLIMAGLSSHIFLASAAEPDETQPNPRMSKLSTVPASPRDDLTLRSSTKLPPAKPKAALEQTIEDLLLTRLNKFESRLIIGYAGGFIDWTDDTRPITASQRFSFVLDLLVKYPDFTMHKKVAEVGGLYERDFAFIRFAIKTRGNKAEGIDFKLAELDKFVRREFEVLSFSDLNFIAYWWTEALSSRSVQSVGSFLNEYQILLKAHLERGCWSRSGILPMEYIFSKGVVVPHISKTGAVPISIFNESYGFQINSQKVGSMDWLAVGTNEILNYDYVRGTDAFKSWYHDYEHAQRCGRMAPVSLDGRTKNIINLKSQIELLSGVKRLEADLAFFYTFHESQEPQEVISEYLKDEIERTKKKLKEGLTLTGTGFGSPEQFETDIAGAKSVGLEIDGTDLLEKQAVFLKHLLAGYESLQNLAKYHDGSKEFTEEEEALYETYINEFCKKNSIKSKKSTSRSLLDQAILKGAKTPEAFFNR